MLRNGRRYNRYGGFAQRAVSLASNAYTGAHVAQRALRAYRGRRNTGRSGQGVTEQYDRKSIYRKKRMPRRKRKRWAAFSKKVHAASEKDLGTKTVLFNDQKDYVISGVNVPGKQAVFHLALYPVNHGGSSPEYTDLNTIAGKDVEVGNSGKFLFKSGVLDVTLQNDSQEDDGAGEPGAAMGIELDVYELTFGRSFETVDGSKGPEDLWTQAFADTPLIGTAANNISINSRGATPWDCPQGLGQWRCTIVKKTKYFLPPRNTMTYQMRDPKRHVFDKQWLLDQGGVNAPGKTKFLMFVAKALPAHTSGLGVRLRCRVGVTRKYCYKHKLDSSDADFYNS